MTNQRFKRTLSETIDALFVRASDLNLDIPTWATRAGICEDTIERIASGKTRFPYRQTIQAMALAVDSTISVTDPLAGRKRGAA